jgi:hypothetical protein
MLRLVRRIRAALRAHDRLPTVCVSVLGEGGSTVDLVTFRVTVERDDRDRLCLVPADGETVWWEARGPAVVVGLRREGRTYPLRNPRRVAAGDRVLVDRTWLIGEVDG